MGTTLLTDVGIRAAKSALQWKFLWNQTTICGVELPEMRENPMRAIAVTILTISQLTLVPFVNQLSMNTAIRPAVAVNQPEQNRNVTVIYKRDGVGTVVDRSPGLLG